MYDKLRSFELSEKDQLNLGVSEVTAMFDEHLNGIIINHPENGLAAGDRIRSRTASKDDDRLVFALTDDHTAEQSIRLTEARQGTEGSAITSVIGKLSIIGMTLPKLDGRDADTISRYEASLRTVMQSEVRAINPYKKQAVVELEQGIEALQQRGHTVPAGAKDAAMRAVSQFTKRQGQLSKQQEASKQRKQALRQEAVIDYGVKRQLREQAALHSSIVDAPEQFLHEAVRRAAKPGNLTVNNAWYHRKDKDSWQHLVLAQEGWEPLYGSLMKPMSSLAGQTLKSYAQRPGALLAHYTSRLLALEDAIDLSRIGGDYDRLADSLMEVLFEAEDLVINDRIKDSIAAARKYKFLLRYRVRPGSLPSQEWYGGLPTIRSGREQVDDKFIPEDPFEGLAYDDEL